MSQGVLDTYDVTVPTNACASEARRSSRITRHTVVCETGIIKRLRGSKLVESDISIRGKGDPGFSTVTVGAFTAATPKIIAVEGEQMNTGEFSNFEITAKMYSTAGQTAGGTPGGTAPGTAFQYGDFAITAIATAAVTRIRLRKFVEVGQPVLDEDGVFATNETFGLAFEATVEGVGDAIPTALELGKAGADISYMTTGVSLVESAEERQESGREPTWEVSIFNAPGAT